MDAYPIPTSREHRGLKTSGLKKFGMTHVYSKISTAISGNVLILTQISQYLNTL